MLTQFKTKLSLTMSILSTIIQAEVPTPVPVSTFVDPNYANVEPAYNYNFSFPFDADVLLNDPETYEPELSYRYFMSVFGPRYKAVSSSNIDYYDFHQGSDMSANVTDNGDVYDEENPPDIYCMCDGIIDKIEDGPEEVVEETGGGRYVRVKCNDSFNGNPGWGNIYMAFRHLNIINPALVLGNPIQKGDLVGLMGETGHTTTTHLHYSVRRYDGQGFHNVHPMRVFNPTATPHMVKALQDADITQLNYQPNQALFRVAIPYNQAVIRAITVKLANGNYEKTYDFEYVSATADASNRDHNDFIDGIELFAYPFNRGQTAYVRYQDAKDDMPAAYPASPERGAGNYFPFLNEGLLATPAYVLDVLAKDLPNGYDINDVKIQIIDIFGNVIEANGTSQLNNDADDFAFSMINDDDDDAEEYEDGEVDAGGSDLEIVYDGSSRGNQTIGLRFNELNIPKGVTIRSASIQFMADETDDDVTSLSIRGEKTGSALSFEETDFNISDRATTNASVFWDPGDWDVVGEMGVAQQTPDITSIVQEVVMHADWNESSSLGIIITGIGKRVAESHDASSKKAAYIYVEYADEFAVPENVFPSVTLTQPTDNTDYASLEIIDMVANAADLDGVVNDVEFFVNDVSIGIVNQEPFTLSWQISDYGTHTLYSVATDDEGAATQSNIALINVYQNVVDVQINDEDDDVEERESGSIQKGGSDLELAYDSYVSSNYGPSGNQHIGLRFQNVGIPAGATVTNAYIQFTADETDEDDVNLTIQGDVSGSAAAFSYAINNVSGRTKTVASVNWQPEVWSSIGQAGEAERTPDISFIVQEIIDLQDWAGGHNMVIIISGTGTRTAESVDGSPADAPILHIEYNMN